MKNFFIGLSILLIIFLTLFPRITEVASRNYIFGYDQGRDYLAVSQIVVNHKLTLIGSEIGAGAAGFTGIFEGPLYYYLLSIPFFFFHGDPYGGVVLMFFFGVGTVFLSFYFGKKLFGFRGGLLTAFLVAVSPPIIPQARFIWNPNPSTFFVLLAFLCAYYMKDKKNLMIFLAAFLSGLVYNFEIAMAIPMCLGMCIYALGVIKWQIQKYFFLIFGFIFAFSPMFLFDLRHHFIGFRGLYTYVFEHKKTQITQLFFQKLLQNHLGTFIYNFHDTFPHEIISQSTIFLIIFIILSIVYLFREKDAQLRWYLVYLCMLPIISFLLLLELRTDVFSYYLYELNIVYILFFTYIAISSYQKRHRMVTLGIGMCILSFVITAIPFSITNFRADYKDYGGDAKIKGKIAAIEYIYTDARKAPFGLLVFSPPVYTYPYDYIIRWYGVRKYNYMPYTDKKGTFYLLIEKDPYKPWSYNGWLQTVVKIGKIVWTKTLPSGFIIQKRVYTDET